MSRNVKMKKRLALAGLLAAIVLTARAATAEEKLGPTANLPIASGPSAGVARLGIEQQIIRDGIELRNRGEIGGRAYSNRLHDGKAKAGTNGGYAFRSFAPMQLKELRIERGDRRRERCIVGIDRQQNLARLARGLPAETRGLL